MLNVLPGTHYSYFMNLPMHKLHLHGIPVAFICLAVLHLCMRLFSIVFAALQENSDLYWTTLQTILKDDFHMFSVHSWCCSRI